MFSTPTMPSFARSVELMVSFSRIACWSRRLRSSDSRVRTSPPSSLTTIWATTASSVSYVESMLSRAACSGESIPASPVPPVASVPTTAPAPTTAVRTRTSATTNLLCETSASAYREANRGFIVAGTSRGFEGTVRSSLADETARWNDSSRYRRSSGHQERWNIPTIWDDRAERRGTTKERKERERRKETTKRDDERGRSRGDPD